MRRGMRKEGEAYFCAETVAAEVVGACGDIDIVGGVCVIWGDDQGIEYLNVGHCRSVCTLPRPLCAYISFVKGYIKWPRKGGGRGTMLLPLLTSLSVLNPSLPYSAIAVSPGDPTPSAATEEICKLNERVANLIYLSYFLANHTDYRQWWPRF